MNMLPKVSDLVMEKERVYLKRTTNAVFPYKPYEILWSNRGTSYYDGKDLYIKHDLSTFFTLEPCTEKNNRIFRITHTFHERGHMEFDNLEVYRDFINSLSSTNRKDWEDNVKYPQNFVSSMSNIIIDGRMENLTAIAYPFTKSYFEYTTKIWYEDSLADVFNTEQFMTLFLFRCRGLEDREIYRPEVIELMDKVQDYITISRDVHSTKECLEQLAIILPIIWPTFYEWLKAEQELKEDDNEPSFDQSDLHDNSVWGNDESIQNAIERLLKKLVSQTADAEKSDSEIDAMLDKVEKDMQAEKAEAQSELSPYQKSEMEVNINTKRVSFADSVSINPYPYSNISCYNTIAAKTRIQTMGMTKALKQLLQATDDEVHSRQRSGKLKANQMWKGSVLNEHTYFTKKVDGTPSTGVRIGIMADVSGSTRSKFRKSKHAVIDEIKNCLVTLAESTHELKIPTCIYAFTENENVDIYPIKPFGRLGVLEKGFIGGLEDMNGNRDTLALQYIVDEMKKYREEVRVIFMISDGQPCFERNEGPDTMRSIVLQAEKMGIHVICLYCGPEHKQTLDLVTHMYPGGAINVGVNMGRDLSNRLKKIIAKHK